MAVKYVGYKNEILDACFRSGNSFHSIFPRVFHVKKAFHADSRHPRHPEN